MSIKNQPSVPCVVSRSFIGRGHMNPAVTFGVMIVGGIDSLLALLFIIAQLTGSVVGCFMTFKLLGYNTFELIGGAHTLTSDVTAWEGLLAEMIFTGILVFVVIFEAFENEETKSRRALLLTGFAVTIGIFAGTHSKGGASMNPARSFGPTFLMTCIYGTPLDGKTHIWKDHWVFWLGPALGAFFATILYVIYDWMNLPEEENEFEGIADEVLETVSTFSRILSL